jgi:hypothetical protein
LADRANISASWGDISTPTIDGEEALSWLIDRSLMRPRYLIQLVDECIGHADSAGHDRIEEDDLRIGYRSFSQDVIGNTSFEMRDVMPESEDAIYTLIGSKRCTTVGEVKSLLTENGFGGNEERILNLFFWFAVLGAKTPTNGERYIYNYRYDEKLFSRMRARNDSDNEVVYINPAFAAGLDCVDLI